MKGTDLLHGEHKDDLFVFEATKQHEDIYTCVCTWTHYQHTYNTSGSRKLIHSEMGFYRKIEILSPTTSVQLADEGVGIKLNCSVLCGTNVKRDCAARWDIKGQPVQLMDGYSQTSTVVIEKDSQNSISTAILTIERVSAKDFQQEFQCVGVELYTSHFVTLTLRQRESVVPLVVRGVCVFLTCVFAAALIRCFALDLALLFRPYLPRRTHSEDVKLYDAYVVYQTQELDRDTEDRICRFVSSALPSVLEDKCGYRLFIQGRDDIPGQDRLELVERCLRQSRRLIVVLTPGSNPESETTDRCPVSNHSSVTGGFDWQVGLHQALVQRELSVILIQLGDTGPQGYTHLLPGLQHLIRKSAPIRWPEGTRAAAAWNSHFWKRVRFLMPATPTKRCELSALL
ncbi:interleukin-1 receptor-like 1 [Austrofundulus limnaeus]|uniref:Interleukin-1 receptor-like 1 n=1 Tax=Austrofundulus limnaeus TaxID=52670 RepID=A0A2I4D773_AUSLI|nr:PREDICTED: interleukin-1 receptor-like 1 [Austrofundulus limnaeus]